MEFSPALVEQLQSLTDALDDPVVDLHAILSVLTDDVTAAVPSFLGLSITTYLGEDAVTLSTIDSPAAGTSLQLPLSALPGEPECEVVLHAGQPGALVGLVAASRSVALDLGGQGIRNAHLPPPTARLYPAMALSVAELSQINQAVGVLLDRGDADTPAAARALLQARADEHGIALAAAARRELQHLPSNRR